jgi:starvation-inducible DNA-binding protein
MKNDLTLQLNRLLADHLVLYQKLRAYHWNVRGPLFFELHAKFEALYGEAADTVDALAESVLALGGRPVATLAEGLALARLAEDAGAPGAQDMVRTLADDLGRLIPALRATAEAARASDPATANLLEGFADGQEKTAWMLRAFLAA